VVAERYPAIDYLSQENLGPSGAKNRGLEAASGQFVMFLDADDELSSGAVDSFVRCLQAHPTCAYAYGHQQFIDGSGAVILSRPRRLVRYQTCIEDDPYRHMLRTNHPIRVSGAVCYRTDLLRDVGGFAPCLVSAEDLDLNLRHLLQRPHHSVLPRP
jgi:glycosyltransferase involved in cell wall biosynthesis